MSASSDGRLPDIPASATHRGYIYYRALSPTGYYTRLYSNTKAAGGGQELKELAQFHGRTFAWKVTVTSGVGTFGISQGKDATDALNNLSLTTRYSESDPGSLWVKVSVDGVPLLLEVWYWEDRA